MKKLYFILFWFISFGEVLAKGNQDGDSEEKKNIIFSIISPDFLVNVIIAIIVLIITFFLTRIIGSWITRVMERRSNGVARDEMIGVIVRVITITILMLGIIIALQFLGVDMGIFMGGFGFGLGFTLKIFLSNFIGGIIMVTQDTYHNGDLIKIENKMGYIQNINALFTTVKQFDGVIFNIPNVKFLENNVENYYTNKLRRVEINVGVDYSTDIVKAKKVIIQILENFPSVLKAPYPEIIVKHFENSSINLGVRFWIDSEADYFMIKSNVTETINLGFKKAGITIPFPQVTLSNRENFEVNVKK